MTAIEQLIRPDIAGLEPYTPIVPFEVLAERLGLPIDEIIKLDANENPYGPSPRAIAALAAAGHQQTSPYAIYPDPDQQRIRRAISSYINQPIERIFCGNGSDEVIDLLMRVLIQPGDVVIDCPPTFGMYAFSTGVAGGRLVQVRRREDFSIDGDQLAQTVAASKAKLVFLASPNNPDGSLLPREIVERLLELPAVIVVDEAYAEFSGSSVVDMVGRYPNLVVLRTFSKWAGLAGLRIGYGLIPEPLIEHLWKIKPPYNINVAAEVAALASLEDSHHLMQNVRRLADERERVYAQLQAIPGLQPYPSQTNFILFRLPGADAYAVKTGLEQRGVLLRYYRKPGLENCLRISIGRPEQNDRALAALREVLAAQPTNHAAASQSA